MPTEAVGLQYRFSKYVIGVSHFSYLRSSTSSVINFFVFFRVFRGYFFTVSDTSSIHRINPWTIATLALIVILPLLTYPLNLVPPPWMFRYSFRFEFPWPGLVLTGLFVAVARGVWRGEIQMGTQMLCLALIAILGTWFASVLVSAHRPFSASFVPTCLGLLSIFWVASRVPSTDLSRIGHAWFVMTLVVTVWGFTKYQFVPEFYSTFGNRNFLAAFLVPGLLIGFTVIWQRLRDRQWISAAVLGLGCVLILMGLWLCRSRGAWLALLSAMAFWFVFLAPLWRHRRIWKLTAVVVLGAAGFWVGREQIASAWVNEVRPPIWAGTIDMIKDLPLFGHGLGMYDIELYEYLPPEQYERRKAAMSIFHAHNEPLELAAEQGLVGLAVMAGLCLLVFYRALNQMERPDCENDLRLSLWGVCSALVAYLTQSSVDVISRIPPNQSLIWLLAGLLASTGEWTSAKQVVWRPERPKRLLLGSAMLLAALMALWVAVIQPVRAEYHEQVTRIALSNSQLERAAVHCSQSLAANPFQLETRFMYAGVFANWADLVEQKDPSVAVKLRKMAIAECEEMRKIAPDYDTVAIRLAFLLAKDGQFEKARDLAKWVLARRPNEKDAIRLLGLLEKEETLPPQNTRKDGS
jgi:O-antigen ligase